MFLSNENYAFNGQPYAGRGIVINVFRFLLGSDGHKAIQDGRSQVVALYLGLFTRGVE
jgi:hypothetical protein